MKIYQNKKEPWKNIFIIKNKYEKSFFFHVKRTPQNQWMKKPRFHAMVNLYLLSFWRDNSNFRIGVGFGKKQWSINIHSLI